MNKLYLALLILVGLINFLPIIGIISIEKINQVYGLDIHDNNLAILLRHRALLFGIIGAQYQSAAIIMAAISMVGYLLFFGTIGGANSELLKVAQVDVVGIVLLTVAVALRYFIKNP